MGILKIKQYKAVAKAINSGLNGNETAAATGLSVANVSKIKNLIKKGKVEGITLNPNPPPRRPAVKEVYATNAKTKIVNSVVKTPAPKLVKRDPTPEELIAAQEIMRIGEIAFSDVFTEEMVELRQQNLLDMMRLVNSGEGLEIDKYSLEMVKAINAVMAQMFNERKEMLNMGGNLIGLQAKQQASRTIDGEDGNAEMPQDIADRISAILSVKPKQING